MNIPPIGHFQELRPFLDKGSTDSEKKNPKSRDAVQAQLRGLELQHSRQEISYQNPRRSFTGHIETLDLSAQIQKGDKLYNIELEVEISVFQFASQQSPADFQNELLDVLPEEARERVKGYLAEDPETLAEMLSPEKVSQNIFDFAQANFPKFLNNRPDSLAERESYLDIVKPAVDKGFDDALSLLEAFLDENTQELVSDTRTLTHDKLDGLLGLNIAA